MRSIIFHRKKRGVIFLNQQIFILKLHSYCLQLVLVIFYFSINTLSAQTELDSLILDLKFESLSQNDFQKLEYTSFERQANTNHLKKLGLKLTSNCHEICEAFLVDSLTGKSRWIPSNYDAGMIGYEFSPTGNKFIVFSAYDGPDYIQYYDWRAEFFIYEITKEKGLDALQLVSSYYATDWSIENIVWIDDNSIALKIYEEERPGDGSKLKFKYLKTIIQ